MLFRGDVRARVARTIAAEARLVFEHEQVRTGRGRVVPLSDHVGIRAQVRLGA